jgi:hypothetical protein
MPLSALKQKSNQGDSQSNKASFILPDEDTPNTLTFTITNMLRISVVCSLGLYYLSLWLGSLSPRPISLPMAWEVCLLNLYYLSLWLGKSVS